VDAGLAGLIGAITGAVITAGVQFGLRRSDRSANVKGQQARTYLEFMAAMREVVESRSAMLRLEEELGEAQSQVLREAAMLSDAQDRMQAWEDKKVVVEQQSEKVGDDETGSAHRAEDVRASAVSLEQLIAEGEHLVAKVDNLTHSKAAIERHSDTLAHKLDALVLQGEENDRAGRAVLAELMVTIDPQMIESVQALVSAVAAFSEEPSLERYAEYQESEGEYLLVVRQTVA